jgi:hypothetical protein
MIGRPGRRLAALAPLLALGAGGSTQAAWQADLRIERIELTQASGLVTVRVALYSDNDHPARNAAVHIFLPVGSKAARVPPGCLPSPSPSDGSQARVDCQLGELRVREGRDVSLVATVPSTGGRFAAFVFSDTPDPVPSNNYAERVLPAAAVESRRAQSH